MVSLASSNPWPHGAQGTRLHFYLIVQFQHTCIVVSELLTHCPAKGKKNALDTNSQGNFIQDYCNRRKGQNLTLLWWEMRGFMSAGVSWCKVLKLLQRWLISGICPAHWVIPEFANIFLYDLGLLVFQLAPIKIRFLPSHREQVTGAFLSLMTVLQKNVSFIVVIIISARDYT